MAEGGKRFFATAAWVNGEWAQDVLLTVGADGLWAGIDANTPQEARAGATTLTGPVLPGLVNAHSHAFQRAIAGLTERSESQDDDFWSWRDRMYSAANRITPGQLEAIAAFLYAELLQAGYTHVCEFHYLHNDVGGAAYADPMEMSLAIVRAAQRTGIGLTLLPTLYMRQGFAAKGLREDQARFASTPDSVMRIAQEIRARESAASNVTAGVALHSIRAVARQQLRDVAASAARMPIHIHIAEQRREIEDCVAEHGQRPIEWLLEHVGIDQRWNLVHATHATPRELDGVREKGAAIVLCPTTEGNLGDGIFDLPSWLGRSGNWSIGSDSHVTRSWQEELRLLEYSQRLALRKRNVAASSALSVSSAAALFQGALHGGPAAAGVALGGLAVGQRADFSVIDTDSPSLAGVPRSHLLDAAIFSSPDARLRDVHVAGKAVPAADPAIRGEFIAAMQALWA
ncbi:formimidoylglutamate deiminase [Caenimonas koreensis]|uniref:formimidoylglutamate deiminase n=1 Tax=Caenimonas koreensis TaxID=367474 RepID=UPI0037845595